MNTEATRTMDFGRPLVTIKPFSDRYRSLACGLPVLAGAGRRSQELIEHDGCGLLVGEGQAEDWEQALRLASGAPERRRRWSERARKLAEERFSWPRIAARMEAILLEACEGETEAHSPAPIEHRTAEP